MVVCSDGVVGAYCQLTKRVLYSLKLQATVLHASHIARIMAVATKRGTGSYLSHFNNMHAMFRKKYIPRVVFFDRTMSHLIQSYSRVRLGQ